MKPIVLAWKGGEHPFLLRIGELIALERLCDLGADVIRISLLTQTQRVEHVTETFRLGLEGGGMSSVEAKKMLNFALTICSTSTLRPIAAAALGYSLTWDVDDQPGEAQAEASQTPDLRSQTEKPDGPTISASAAQSASPERRLNA